MKTSNIKRKFVFEGIIYSHKIVISKSCKPVSDFRLILKYIFSFNSRYLLASSVPMSDPYIWSLVINIKKGNLLILHIDGTFILNCSWKKQIKFHAFIIYRLNDFFFLISTDPFWKSKSVSWLGTVIAEYAYYVIE